MKKYFFIVFALLSIAPVYAQQPDWSDIEKILGRKGVIHGDMFKIAFPRTDLEVKVREVQVDPRIGLTSWMTFRANQETTVMGGLVLTVEEVAPVIKKLMAEGIRITSLHNHLMGTSRPIMELHFKGSGSTEKLAVSMKEALSATATPLADAPRPPETIPPEFAIVQYFLNPGKQQGSVLRYDLARNHAIIENGMEITGLMGTYTTLGFQALNGKVAATGDFVLTANEVNPVIKALAEHSIMVTGLDNHMLAETPRLFFLHFWAYDAPEKVANGLKAALDKANIRRQTE